MPLPPLIASAATPESEIVALIAPVPVRFKVVRLASDKAVTVKVPVPVLLKLINGSVEVAPVPIVIEPTPVSFMLNRPMPVPVSAKFVIVKEPDEVSLMV